MLDFETLRLVEHDDDIEQDMQGAMGFVSPPNPILIDLLSSHYPVFLPN